MRIPQKLLLTAAFGAFFVVGCTPGDISEECTSDLDCEGTDQCHPGLNVCVADCTLEDGDDACTAEAPICNRADDDGNYPLEDADPSADQAFRLVCVCIDDTDCGNGEVCDTETRECVAGQSQDECTEDDDCDEGFECSEDGECVAEEIDDTCTSDEQCLGEGGLCDIDGTDQCVPADELTGDCADADTAPAQSGPPHIVVRYVEAVSSEANACGQDPSNPNLPIRTFGFEVYSEVDFDAADVFRANFGDDNRFFGHPSSTLVEHLVGNDYFVTVSVCGNPNGVALYIDDGSSVSNAFCFNATGN